MLSTSFAWRCVAALTMTLSVVLLPGCGDSGEGEEPKDGLGGAGGGGGAGGSSGGGDQNSTGGTCAGCLIDGDCVDDGAANPNNQCERCDTDKDPAAWSSQTDGAACEDGSFCNGHDSCLDGTCSSHEGDPCSGDLPFCYEAQTSCGCAEGWSGEGCGQCVVYVRVDGDDALTGRSWADAVTSVEAALELAETSGCEIWVAEGTYLPQPSTTGDPREATFRLKAGAALYGGFSGTEWAREQRDFAQHVTILSGDIGVTDDSSDNSYHVILGADGATLDGFTVTGGNANGDENGVDGDYSLGSGIYTNGGSLTVAHSSFSNNSATNCGGGIYNGGGLLTVAHSSFSNNSAEVGGGICNSAGSLMVTSSTFENNSATNGGGGIYTHGSGSLAVTNSSSFSNNSATYYGGGIYKNGGSLTVTSSSFSSNSTYSHGGGIYSSNGGSLSVTSSSFSSNSADATGGGIDAGGGSAAVTSCSFSNNSSSNHGGGIYKFGASSLSVTNSTFLANSAAGGGGIYKSGAGSLSVTNSTFLGNSATDGGGIYKFGVSSLSVTNSIVRGQESVSGYLVASASVSHSNLEGGCPSSATCTEVIDEDPRFVNAEGGNLSLLPDSPCVDTGDAAALPADVADLDGDEDVTEPTPFDLEGGPRVRGADVDMGAFETASTP